MAKAVGDGGNKAASEIPREEAKTRIYQGEYTKTAITLQYYAVEAGVYSG